MAFLTTTQLDRNAHPNVLSPKGRHGRSGRPTLCLWHSGCQSLHCTSDTRICIQESALCRDPHGQRHWLFTGSENGRKTMAVLFNHVPSAQRHGHDPFVYLRDVLTRLPDQPKKTLADLLPDRWSPPAVVAAVRPTRHSSSRARLADDQPMPYG